MIRAIQPFLQRRNCLATVRQSVETEFDRKWRKMSDAEKDRIREEWAPLNGSDWRTLTLDQKRACISDPFVTSIYNSIHNRIWSS